MPRKDLRPAPVDFDVVQGTTITIDFTITSGGVPVDLTTWTDLNGSCSNGSLTFPFVIININLANGIGQLRLEAGSSAQVQSPGTMSWDFFGTSETSVVMCLSRGTLHFTPMVSNA